MRRYAKSDRLLFHYNGHGVPRPTSNGEVWVFNKNYTQYIPLSVYDIKAWIGTPSIVVLDCSNAGVLVPFLEQRIDPNAATPNGNGNGAANTMPEGASSSDGSEYDDPIEAVKNTIVLCPCEAGELLPQNPDFPADIFTACLTTPIPIALRFYISQNHLSMSNIHPNCADRIPGKLNDRKTPIGELNWIFTAITDTIAWNTLPSPLFQRLFRQDLLVASLFRNFLLADRIMRKYGCTPSAVPRLPSTCNHPLWLSWDLAVETCLNGLMREGVLGKVKEKGNGECANDMYSQPGGGSNSTVVPTTQNPNPSARNANPRQPHSPNTPGTPGALAGPSGGFVTAPFFAEQLTAFEVWLELGVQQGKGEESEPPRPPEQLPVVLQVLLSQAHRVRAIVLLRRFLSLGPWAVNLALSVGIFPYVLKLLQSPAPELRQILVAIWSKILAFDESCQVDLVKDDAHGHFISHLNWGLTPLPNPKQTSLHQSLPANAPAGDPSASSQRVMAAFILSAIVHDYPVGQQECLNSNLHRSCIQLLVQTEYGTDAHSEYINICENRIPPQFRLWLLIVLAELMKGYEAAQLQMYQHNFYLRLYSRLNDTCSEVRAAACYAIGMLLGGQRKTSQTPIPPKMQQQYDEQRLPLDVVSARALVAACDDGSPIVRYEATVALGSIVSYYLNMFATVANQMMSAGRESESGPIIQVAEPESPMTPAPLLEGDDANPDDDASSKLQGDGSDFGLGLEYSINEETAEDFAFIWTALRGVQHTDPHPNVCAAALAIVQTVHERVLYLQSWQAELQQHHRTSLQEPPMENLAGQQGERHSMHAMPSTMPPGANNRGVTEPGATVFEPPIYQTYLMPVSGFFEWKKKEFSYGQEADDGASNPNKLDPMSFEGSMKAYRKRRDDKTHDAATLLAKKYAHLIPKPKGGLGGSGSDDFGEEMGEAEAKRAKKSSIKMDQSAVLDNDSDMTSNILFHPYENCLVVCDDFDGISVWNFDDGKKEQSFSNSNSNTSRMTSVKWLNDSILAVGCCDGTVRLWDNVVHAANNNVSNGSGNDGPATPASAFFAAPDLTAGQRGSGLVMEWLDQKQTLICSGNSSMVRSWDMEKEQVVSTFATGSDVCLTSLTSACERDDSGAYVSGANAGAGPFGPDVVVCGFGDGALRVFDLRAPSKPVVFYAEHGSWIVNTAFTTFGGRPELLSGCIGGDCKFWDLRLPASLRNLDVQRSPMTAFAVHNKVPLIASGAHAQFLKILDFEGETKNVIRYHEGFLGQRIGAVSCLAFHPYKLLLAAGATDPFISLYSQGE